MIQTNPQTALALDRSRARLDLIEGWASQLEQNPKALIERGQVAATLRLFLTHEPEEAA